MPDFFISQFYHSVNNLKNMVQYIIEFNNHKEKYKGNVMEKIFANEKIDGLAKS